MPKQRMRGPLLSLGASGRLARVFTLAHRLSGPGWLLRGRPDNPRTPAQVSWRTLWQMAAALWHDLSPNEQRQWEIAGTLRHMTGFAWYMSQALRPNPGVYLPLAGGTMTGDIDMDQHQVMDLPAPVADQDAARKGYVDGLVTPGPYTEGARVYHNANQPVGSGVVWFTLALNSEEYDTDTMHDAVVNNERLTFQTAGIYFLHFQMKWGANAAGRRIVGIRNQAGSIIVIQEAAVPGANTFNIACTTVAKVSAADWVETICYQNSGVPLDAIHDIGASCYFIAQRIG